MPSTITVLVVDDSVTMRALVSDALGAAGYAVVCATNGQEALNAVCHRAVHLVITDWNMPDGDGLQLISALRSIESLEHLPILVLSTESDPDCRHAAREAGATGWLGKPVTPEMLVHIANTLVRIRGQGVRSVSPAGSQPSASHSHWQSRALS